MASHDLIISYKSTENHKFPLILVVGREPNSDEPFSKNSGSFDFDTSPRCAFWNISYSSIEGVCGLDKGTLKKLSRDADASPIAFTDASPIPINNSNAEKNSLRSAIIESDIDTHVQNLANLDHILSRTKLVLLSGHREGSLSAIARRNFAYASSRLEDMFDGLGIPHVSVPLMYGNNKSNIVEVVEKNEHIAKNMRGIVGEFEDFALSQSTTLAD